jgi:DNA primase
MPGRIPEDVIDKVRDDTAIEDVIAHFVTLQRKGNSFWACCPFHGEKTPSFHVHPERQIYYCFGCQRGGNVFRFLMDKEGMGFPEAVHWCADRLGMDLDRYLENVDEGPDPREGILKANHWAAEWFQAQLQGPAGKDARAYARSRGLAPETVDAFGLGLAPPRGDSFLAAAKEAGIGDEALLQGSLLRRKPGEAPFAYFRSRLIFPIRGVAQKTNGFGARILGAGEPKYLNSPETPVFKKRQTLYGLPEARSSMVKERTAILVEGYLDALSLHQAGWTQTVATCGTAFTPEQVRVLKRYVNEVVLVFDGDKAGRKAAYRSAEVAILEGVEPRIVRLPEGQDPADLVAAGEGEKILAALQEAPGLVACMHREVEERGGERTHRERALQSLRELAGRMTDPVRGELLLDEVASVFGVSRRALADGFVTPRKKAPAEAPPTVGGEAAGNLEERRLLRLALSSANARRVLLERMPTDRFSTAQLRELVMRLGNLDDDSGPVERVDQLGVEGTDLEPVVARLLSNEDGEPNIDADFDPVAEIDSLLAQLDERTQRRERSKEVAATNEAYYSGGDWKAEMERRLKDSRG